MIFVLGTFLILHGLVHLFYAGLSHHLFDLGAELAWPDGAWAFSRYLSEQSVRTIATVLTVASAVFFVVSGVALYAHQPWWRTVAIAVSILSSLTFLLMWDGVLKKLPDKGMLGILINLGLMLAILVFKWPDFGF